MRLTSLAAFLSVVALQATAVSAQKPAMTATTNAGAGDTVLTTGDGTTMTAGNNGAVISTQSAPASSGSLLQSLQPQELPSGEWHMRPVRAVHARVQSDAPLLHPVKQQFISKMGKDDFEAGYLAGMDGVNTASVEGALMYVQAEGINYDTRSPELRCQRKNNMKYIVFYEVVVAQTNETLAQYQDTADQNEYGPMVPMDQGRCSPTGLARGKDVLPKECYYFNGDNGEPNIGPFVGGESKVADVRAPYPNNIWFSLPNTCPLKVWAEKTPECRASTRKGLCDYGVLPDGIHCTFAYSILGFIPIDDVVGITSMLNNKTGVAFKDFQEFCEAGGVEFKASQEGKWEQSIDFWLNPQDEAANAVRARHVIDAYQTLMSGGSSQVDPSVVQFMRPLPAIEEMASENPKCYENVKRCSAAPCRRETYSQVCRVCVSASSSAADCETAPSGFKFPELEKAVGERIAADGETSSSGSKDHKASKKARGAVKPVSAATKNASGGVSMIAVVAVAVAWWV